MSTTICKPKKSKTKHPATNTGSSAPQSKGPPTPQSQVEPIQFNWSKDWKTKVEPYLALPLVRRSVEIGMWLYDKNWTWADGPHSIGRGQWNGQRVVKNKLSWYQPWGRCHWISFFACSIGVLNYPDLDWQFLSGHCHTVPVGMLDGQPQVVMDILYFKDMTAAQSIANAQRVPPGGGEPDPNRGQWDKLFSVYLEKTVPSLREVASDPSLALASSTPVDGQLTCPWL